MKVVDTLTGLRPLIQHQTVTFAVDLALVRNPVGDADHLGKHCGMIVGQLMHRWDMRFGNDQHVGWSDGSNIFESDDLVVAIDLLRIDLFPEDLAEKAVFSHGASLRADQTVGDRRHRTDARQRTERLLTIRGVHGDVVIAQAAQTVREAAIPDDLQRTVEKSGLKGAPLPLGLRLQ